jgi:LytS/YehU family sensor histidine kinase
MLVSVSMATAMTLASAAILRTVALGWWLRMLKGVITGLEVCGLWMLAFRYPEVLQESPVRAFEVARAQQAAELMRLREHLQPHFLRNTLNAIAALIDEEPSEARDLLAAVADLLTDSIEDSAPQRPLGIELAWLRYRGSLHVAWDEEPMTSATLVPRLLLQRLVENAVHHGALARRTDGCVTVRTRARRGGGAIVEVEDNGPVISPSGSSAIGLGLRLVRQRVDLESHGSFRLESTPNGTRAIVELP